MIDISGKSACNIFTVQGIFKKAIHIQLIRLNSLKAIPYLSMMLYTDKQRCERIYKKDGRKNTF
jgi:hypothetical protein